MTTDLKKLYYPPTINFSNTKSQSRSRYTLHRYILKTASHPPPHHCCTHKNSKFELSCYRRQKTENCVPVSGLSIGVSTHLRLCEEDTPLAPLGEGELHGFGVGNGACAQSGHSSIQRVAHVGCGCSAAHQTRYWNRGEENQVLLQNKLKTDIKKNSLNFFTL